MGAAILPTTFFLLPFILHIANSVWGHGVCSLVNSEALLEFRSEFRSDALPTTATKFSEIRTRDSLRTNLVL